MHANVFKKEKELEWKNNNNNRRKEFFIHFFFLMKRQEKERFVHFLGTSRTSTRRKLKVLIIFVFVIKERHT